MKKIKKIVSMVLVTSTVLLYSVSAFAFGTSNAKTYSDKYAEFPNVSYIFFPQGDCSNFVSQIMRAGGYVNNNDWFYHGYTSMSKTWINAHSLHWHIKAHRQAPLIGKWHGAGSYGLYKPVDDSSNLDGTGNKVLFYDFDSDGNIDHASYVVASGKSIDGTGTGDLINQHTTNRKRTMWHLEDFNSKRYTTTIYAYNLK